MDERTLIESAKKSKHALSILLSNHHKMVYGFLLQLTCDQSLAEDLTQDTMVKAIMNIKKFRYESKFSTWLFTIANNTYKNHIKKHKRVVLKPLEETLESSFNTEKTVMMEDDFHKIMAHLKEMKDDQRIPFLLKHYYGYSYEEIATIMKCPVGTVRSRIHNTIKKLQKHLGGHNEL
jgi:RNA polymerase sigma-70 factor (ECF subfamily)